MMGDRDKGSSVYLTSENRNWVNGTGGFGLSGWVDQGVELVREKKIPVLWSDMVEAWEFFQAHQAQEMLGRVVSGD